MSEVKLPGVSTLQAFDSADYYDCRNVERFEYETLDECIEAYIDDLGGPADDVVKLIHDVGSVTVSAHSHLVVGEDNAKRAARYLIDKAQEQWDEEYGDPEDSSADFSGFISRLEELVMEMWKSEKPWMCTKIAEREFSQSRACRAERHGRWHR